jgi:hypothetical protein
MPISIALAVQSSSKKGSFQFSISQHISLALDNPGKRTSIDKRKLLCYNLSPRRQKSRRPSRALLCKEASDARSYATACRLIIRFQDANADINRTRRTIILRNLSFHMRAGMTISMSCAARSDACPLQALPPIIPDGRCMRPNPERMRKNENWIFRPSRHFYPSSGADYQR